MACPRAACPFDEEEQAKPYPCDYTLGMVRLGNELRRIAQRYTLANDTKLWLKVGINCGPLAGAVTGSLRCFYCLYGDTINTAARMCKYASDRVHGSAAFAALLRRGDAAAAAAAAAIPA